jgi:hypothetical protein
MERLLYVGLHNDHRAFPVSDQVLQRTELVGWQWILVIMGCIVAKVPRRARNAITTREIERADGAEAPRTSL